MKIKNYYKKMNVMGNQILQDIIIEKSKNLKISSFLYNIIYNII